MNNRRRLILAIGTALSLPRTGIGQSKKPPVLIGWLNGGSRDSNMWQLAAFKEGLAALGYKEGEQIVIDERWADARTERLQPLAEELTLKKPLIIVASPSQAVRAAAKAAPATPVVQGSGGDPVETGLVKSLARPGGMITGLSNAVNEIQQKYFELLVAAVPKTKRIGVLQDSSTLAADSRARNKEAVKRWATQNAVEVHYEDVAAPEDIEHAVGRLAKQSMQALVVLPSAMLGAEAPRVAKLAMTQRWPVISGSTRQPESGWLLSYSADNSANFRRAAHYVDRILKGAKPGDLPIERPMTFDLVINLKSAKALGLTMPPEIMVRATRVIE